MQIGEVIRKYRKQQNMTQEEMAYRLGVTTPAVNKWENGNSMPDIMLLAPIARLLNISLDTLLSFQEELTEKEINEIVIRINEHFKKHSFEHVFQEAKKMIETYPNCERLIWQIAVILDAQRLFGNNLETEKYDDYILKCYIRVLESKGKQALIYSKTDRREEAYKAYEELLFSGYQTLSAVFQSIYTLAMQDNYLDKAHKMVEKQQEIARIFEMGKYHEVSCGLELATLEKDTDKVLEIMEEMLRGIEKIAAFTESELYEHMTFKKANQEFMDEMKKNLIACFRDEETYGFLKGEGRWKQIAK